MRTNHRPCPPSRVARVLALYQRSNWTAERIARHYPSSFRNQWDVYALLRKHAVTKATESSARKARQPALDRLHAKQLSRVKVPPLEVDARIFRCWHCACLSTTVRCEHCLKLINPTITRADDRHIRTTRGGR